MRTRLAVLMWLLTLAGLLAPTFPHALAADCGSAEAVMTGMTDDCDDHPAAMPAECCTPGCSMLAMLLATGPEPAEDRAELVVAVRLESIPDPGEPETPLRPPR